MKKTILFTLALILGLATQSQAQSEDYPINIGLSANYTLTETAFNLIINAAEDTAEDVIDKKSFPSLQLTADYSIKKWFSIGLAGSYQKLGFNTTDTYTDQDGNTGTETYNIEWARSTVAVRPLFHYANNDRLDLYSGLRIQYFNGKFSSDTKDANRLEEFTGEADIDTNFRKLGIGITAFGVRYYITENIGIGTEINLGRPYVSNFSINARF